MGMEQKTLTLSYLPGAACRHREVKCGLEPHIQGTGLQATDREEPLLCALLCTLTEKRN